MLHDPAASWIWSQDAVTDGAVERASPGELMDFLMELRDVRGRTDAR
jgi:hypothetical protein